MANKAAVCVCGVCAPEPQPALMSTVAPAAAGHAQPGRAAHTPPTLPLLLLLTAAPAWRQQRPAVPAAYPATGAEHASTAKA